jgi:hypothetical protein
MAASEDRPPFKPQRQVGDAHRLEPIGDREAFDACYLASIKDFHIVIMRRTTRSVPCLPGAACRMARKLFLRHGVGGRPGDRRAALIY